MDFLRVNIMLRRVMPLRRKSQNQVQEGDYFLMMEKTYLHQVNLRPLFQANHQQVCK